MERGTQHNHIEKTVVLQDEGLRKLKGFVQIPKAVLLCKKISYGAKVAYGVLLGYAWQDDFCFPAQKALADDLSCSIRQAQRFLDELKKEEFVTWRQIGLNRPNVYSILPLPIVEQTLQPASHRVNNTEKVAKTKDTTNMSYPDMTHLSQPEATHLSLQDTTQESYKEYPVNNTQNIVNVNDEQKKEDKTDLRKLPDLEQPKDKTQYVADEIYNELRDKQSKGFYYLVAAKVPESVIRQTLAEIKLGGARSPERVFTSRMKTYAAEKLAIHTAQNLYADMAAVAKQKAFR